MDWGEIALLAFFAKGDPSEAIVLTQRLKRMLTVCLVITASRKILRRGRFLRLLRLVMDWRSNKGQLATWLYRVVSTFCIDRSRQCRHKLLNAVEDPPYITERANQTLQQQISATAFQSALLILPEQQRQTVILRKT